MARSTANSMSQSRYNFGVYVMSHKDKLVTTSVGSDYDGFVRLNKLKDSKPGHVPAATAQRPDLISNIFYDTPGYWWYPMQYNGFTDPFEDLQSGRLISIPEL
jgi:hypothetical protein